MRPTRILRLGVVSALLVSVAGRGAAAESALRRLAVVGPAAPPAFAESARVAGFELLPRPLPAQTAPDVLCVVTPFGKDAAERSAVVASASECLRRGGTLILALGANPEQAAEFAELLPVNSWSFSKDSLRRSDAGAEMPPRSPWPAVPALPGFRVASRFDLHLPYAAVEAGEHRYQWQTYGKPLPNTDWQVVLATNRDGHLPLLVAGRLGPGHVLLFGASLYDEALVAWPEYGNFIKGLLGLAKPERAVTTPPPSAPAATIEIPRHQPGALHVIVHNAAPAASDLVLLYKVRNAEHALLNSASQAVTVPAQGTLTVPLTECSPELGAAGLAASADRARSFRHLEAGLAPVDRSAVWAQTAALVDTVPAVTLAIEGEDIRSCVDLADWPERGHGAGRDMAGGAPIYRYVYLTGTQSTLTVVVRNGLHNIAPLATPADVNWPENPTTQGLNDLAYSHGSLRDKIPLYGAWGGKSAATQSLRLTWPAPVWIAEQNLVGQTAWRRWDRSNPQNYSVAAAAATAAAAQPLVTVKDAVYVNARRHDAWPAVATTACTLTVMGLDPTANQEPKPVSPANSALTEWEVLGWPGPTLPPPVAGKLEVTATDLLAGTTQPLFAGDITVASAGDVATPVRLAAKADFGPVRIDATFTVAGQVTRASFDVLFVPPDRDAIISTKTLGEKEMGLLCSPGLLVFDEFGLGTTADTQGWGGDDDKIWALTHDFMELGTRNADVAARLFTTSARFCHYTCPWRDFPSGEYFWDFATDRLLEMVTTGKFKGTKSLRIFLSDRWNGIPVGATFAWADFIRFDEYLRGAGGPGLTGRSRKQLITEITGQYADQWQSWQMNRYADKLLDTQRRLAAVGVAFSVTTHGSFPLAGGELGAKLGRTHKATGTDLFWELRNEDLYGSIGSRFGLIAANPDFESGAYNEWGWVSAVLNNPHWFAESGTVEPSRRQWYSTYFAGRVTSTGEFRPFTKYGFDAQGGFGVKNTVNDWQQYYRTMQFATRVRPEAPAGFGLVVSWRLQERRMGAKAGPLGFGLYTAAGLDQVDTLAGEVYQKLVKNGVPIGFVTSTHALKNWKGTNPLIAVDGLGYEDWELAELERLHKAGAPVFLVGGASAASARSALPACETGGKALTAAQAAALAQRLVGEVAGASVTVSAGVAVTPFISNDRLFLALGDQGDVNRTVTVSVRPASFMKDWTGDKFRVIDVDQATELPSTCKAGVLSFAVPTAASDGRLVLIDRGAK